MKRIALLAIMTATLGSASLVTTAAEAKGCIKGALVGGVAGHFAGHHGLLGAAAGCVIGRHRANQQTRDQEQQGRPDRQVQPQPAQ